MEENSKMNCKKGKLNGEKILKIWKKCKLNSDKIWTKWKKGKLNRKRYGKYGRKPS